MDGCGYLPTGRAGRFSIVFRPTKNGEFVFIGYRYQNQIFCIASLFLFSVGSVEHVTLLTLCGGGDKQSGPADL